MTPAQRQRVKDLFDAAFELAPAEQAHWLAEACQDDSAVRAEAEKLLRLQATTPEWLAAHSAAELLGLPATPAVAESMTGRQIGPYRLLRELGKGGMGMVYLAERADGVHSQPVALKLVWPGFGSEAVLRFQQERALLARLVHPHIARLLDGGTTEEGWHYLVMEYVEGQPLTAYCRTHRLSIPARLALFRTVCEAVQYAHQNLIVHRDLKPANLLVTADGAPKLLDFGIAKLLERGNDPSTLTRSGQQPFTPLYASPEQIRNEPITTASDVYSLGVLFYQLLTGINPYRTETDADMLRAVCEEEPERPSLRVAEQPELLAQFGETTLARWQGRLRGDLDNIALKALQKDVRRRYATVEQLSDDLQRHLNGEPVTARRATLRYRTGKYVRRNKTFVIAAGLLAVALIVGALVTLWQLRASRAREHAQRYELYAADMRQAGADWGEGNLVHMDELLERHRPGNRIDDEWRGFEWFALWKLLHTEQFTKRHPVSTAVVAFTPDGKALLTSTGWRVEKWDARSGASLGLFAHGAIQLQFFNAGTRLIVNNGFRELSIWDYFNQRKLIEFSPSSPSYYRHLTFALSPDETRLVTSLYGQQFQLWDTTTGQLLDTFTVPAGVEAVLEGPAIYSPAGRPLCLVRRDKHFELWDLMARRSVVQFDPQSDDPRALRPFNPTGHLLSPDGTRYYLPTEDFRIRVWDFKRGGNPVQILVGHEDHIETPALSHDGKLLASGSNDRTLRLWDTQTGKLLVTLKNESQTFSPTFSPDDRYLAAVCMRALRTKVWDVQSLLASPQAIEGVQTLGLSPDGKMLTYAEGAGPGLRDLRTGQHLLTFTNASFSHCASYDCARISANGRLIALRKDLQQGKQGPVAIREAATGKVLAELSGHTGPISQSGPISAIAFSPDGQAVATGGDSDGQIQIWDTASWRERITLRGHDGTITSLDFSPDGRRLASCGYDGTVRVWDVTSGKMLFNLGDRNSWVLKVRFSPDGRLLASADMSFTIKLWDTATGRLVWTLKGHANTVYALAFSPDGKRLASGSDDRTVRLWDLQTGTELTALRGHTGQVWQVFFAPDGKTLISSGEDGTRIWRTATTP